MRVINIFTSSSKSKKYIANTKKYVNILKIAKTLIIITINFVKI